MKFRDGNAIGFIPSPRRRRCSQTERARTARTFDEFALERSDVSADDLELIATFSEDSLIAIDSQSGALQIFRRKATATTYDAAKPLSAQLANINEANAKFWRPKS